MQLQFRRSTHKAIWSLKKNKNNNTTERGEDTGSSKCEQTECENAFSLVALSFKQTTSKSNKK